MNSTVNFLLAFGLLAVAAVLTVGGSALWWPCLFGIGYAIQAVVAVWVRRWVNR